MLVRPWPLYLVRLKLPTLFVHRKVVFDARGDAVVHLGAHVPGSSIIQRLATCGVTFIARVHRTSSFVS